MRGDFCAQWVAAAVGAENNDGRIVHGIRDAKTGVWLSTPANAGLALFSMLGAQGVLELAGGALILLGLFTRPVAFILAGDMAAAYFIAHAPRGFFPALNGGDAALLYCFVFLYLAVAGAGSWSLGPRRD